MIWVLFYSVNQSNSICAAEGRGMLVLNGKNRVSLFAVCCSLDHRRVPIILFLQ